MLIIHTKMNTSPWHPNRSELNVYNASMTQTMLTLNFRLSMTGTSHYKHNRNRSDSMLLRLTNVVMHVVKVINRAPKITYTCRILEGQSKISLDISGFGGAPRVFVTHLVHAIHWPTIHTWNSMSYRGNTNNYYHRWKMMTNIWHHISLCSQNPWMRDMTWTLS